MNSYKFVQEDLRTDIGTQGQLLVPRTIYDQLIPEHQKSLIPRELAAYYFGPAQIAGYSIDVNMEAINLMTVRQVGEGHEIWKDDPEYTNVNIRPIKYGVRINITREMMEDSKFPLLQRAAALAAKKFAENETSRIIAESLDSAANTVAGGATVTIANITRAMQYLEDADFEPTDILVGMEVANDLRNIDTFFEADKNGGVSPLTNGFVGSIYGMRAWRVSTNAGMTTTSSYVLDRKYAYALAEKRPVTVEGYNLATHDTQGIAVTQRIASAVLRSSAIAKITSS